MQLTARKQRKQSKTELVEPIKLTVSTSDSPSEHVWWVTPVLKMTEAEILH